MILLRIEILYRPERPIITGEIAVTVGHRGAVNHCNSGFSKGL
jgi:hypothetical protein